MAVAPCSTPFWYDTVKNAATCAPKWPPSVIVVLFLCCTANTPPPHYLLLPGTLPFTPRASISIESRHHHHCKGRPKKGGWVEYVHRREKRREKSIPGQTCTRLRFPDHLGVIMTQKNSLVNTGNVTERKMQWWLGTMTSTYTVDTEGIEWQKLDQR